MINKNNSQRIWYKPYNFEEQFQVCFYKTLPINLTSILNLNRKRILVVADTAVKSSFTKSVINLLGKHNTVKLHGFNYGPKSLKNLIPIWKNMVNFIPDLAVGIGGGTTSDLVGLAASTYQRGVPHYIFPTTILGMIDASLGGKTGIDFSGIKNSIGTIHYPQLVVNIMEALTTLSKAEFLSGFAEAIKAGVIFDPDLFDTLQFYGKSQNFSWNNPTLINIIKRSAQLKMKNSEVHPRHKIKLLYGHAIGHALELVLKIRHGEAVAIGMAVEGAIACQLGIWNHKEWLELTTVLKQFSLPTQIPTSVSLKTIVQKMNLYRKLVTEDSLGFIFPRKIGEVFSKNRSYVTYIPKNQFNPLFKTAIKFIKNT